MTKRASGDRGEFGSISTRIISFFMKYPRQLAVVAVAILTIVGAYLRILPALKYGIDLDANDPWIAYWLAEQLRQNGLFSFSSIENVKEFWWPVGRDFLRQEYIGVSWIAAATYPIGQALGLTLKEWIALFPVFAGAATIPLAYLVVVELTGSRIGGVVAAAIFSLYPGAIVRTTVGFVEKTGIAVPFLTLFYILLAKALKVSMSKNDETRALSYAALSGIIGGLISFIWGGYDVAVISLALIILLDPAILKPSQARMKVYMTTSAAMIILISANPGVGPGYFVANLGASLIASLAIYAASIRWAEKGLPILGPYSPRKQAWLVATLFVTAIVVFSSGLLPVSGRILMAMGVRNLSPLAESVQEHQPLPWNSIFNNYGIPLIVFAGGAVYYIYRIYSGRRGVADAIVAPLFLLGFLLVYANKQLAYFTQMASFYISLGAGIATGIMAQGMQREVKSKRRRVAPEKDPIRIMIVGFLLIVILFSSTYYGYTAYRSNSVRAPMILTGGLGPLTVAGEGGKPEIVVPLNNAWINMLNYIKNNTSPDALIVSWWDYGYWITVNTGRKTIADGATFNETQIRTLAQILVGTEGTANYILERMGADPENTYLLFYEVYRGQYDKNQGTLLVFPEPTVTSPRATGLSFGVVTHGTADFPKSFQMLKIAYKIPPFSRSSLFTSYSTEVVDDFGTKWIHFPGFVGIPEENRTNVLHTVLYKLGLYGLTYLNKKDIVITDNQCGFLQNATLVLPSVIAYQTGDGGLRPQVVIPGEPQFFKPEAISVGCPLVTDNGDTISFISVIVFLYKWTGGQ
ncbi:MAG: hypothetical protein F7C08_02230 [Desulfurococcales archaeon]|nr:hypothetical protein [Desulfurococcales archaeon]MCE4605336.1 hypothetical protein [Desulfurococcales archaeon]